MKDKEINRLISEAIRNGDVSFTLTSAFVESWLTGRPAAVPDSVRTRVADRLRASVEDAAIARVIPTVEAHVDSFGVLIRTIRERAGIAEKRIAMRLGKSESYLKRIEQDDLSIRGLDTIDLADIAELFHVTLRRIYELGKAAGLSNALSVVERVYAGRQTEMEIAGEDAWLQDLRSELIQRRRNDLVE